MKLTALNAISPIDGRYRSKTKHLAKYFSEEALIHFRVRVEIEYFIALCEWPLPQLEGFNTSLFEDLRDIYKHFTENDAKEIKEIEKPPITMLKPLSISSKEFDRLELQEYKEFIHFGLTSQDINNTAIPLSIKGALESVFLPQLEEVIDRLTHQAEEYKAVPMLARTHGQLPPLPVWGKSLVFLSNDYSRRKHCWPFRMPQNLVALPEISMRIKWPIPKRIGSLLGVVL